MTTPYFHHFKCGECARRLRLEATEERQGKIFVVRCPSCLAPGRVTIPMPVKKVEPEKGKSSFDDTMKAVDNLLDSVSKDIDSLGRKIDTLFDEV